MRNCGAVRRLPVVSLAAVCLLAGCASPVRLPPHASVGLAHWRTPLPAADAPAPTVWWLAFASPDLQALLRQADADNLDIRAAVLRVRQARLTTGAVRKSFLPEAHLHAQGVQGANGFDAFFQYGLDATWELGLFGRREGEVSVARSRLTAAGADADAARLTVTAEVVKTWIDLKQAQGHLAALDRLDRLDRDSLDLMTKRVALGFAAQDELDRLQQQALADRDPGATARLAVAEAMNRLAVLLGRETPDPAWLRETALPAVTLPPVTAVPADLLRTRPDIATAESRILEAAGSLGIARADLYPYLTLGGGYVYAKNVTRNFEFEGSIHSAPSIAPTFDLPIFDWGRRRAQADARQSGLDAALLDYRQTVLDAVADAESALAALNAREETRTAAEARAALAQHAAAQREKQQALGLATRLQVLDEQRQALLSGISILDARADAGRALVALCKALGGSPTRQTAGGA